MPGLFYSIHVSSFFELLLFLVLWVALYECAHIFVMMLRQEPLIGWAVGPLGLTFMVLREPSLIYIWLDVIFPALVSGSMLYIALFTSFSPVIFHGSSLLKIVLFILGLFITCTNDVFNALRDLNYPLWGEARVLRTIHLLQSTWTKIHFTSFGRSYVRSHFGSNPTDLLRTLSLS